VISAAIGFFTGGNVTRLAATTLAGIAIGGWCAWQVQTWRQGHAQTERLERAAKDLVRQVENRDRAPGAYLQENDDAENAHQAIASAAGAIAGRPGYVVQCFDDDGLQQLRLAIRNAAPAARAGEALRPPR
jgi:hypothetical protein